MTVSYVDTHIKILESKQDVLESYKSKEYVVQNDLPIMFLLLYFDI